ncbi:MAG TPA: pyridoxal-phosphate dependent enzyme, partial [Candidatus Nanoarchaeia archaeon]|nr:pyridoxal-phosphate dependent enzyme [Candidatus Nanoarchaeia archaeon]
YRDIASRCGLDDTPLIDLSNLSQRQSVRIFAKDESKNITGSVKVRAALFNLVKAINGDEQHFLDASSGNYAKALIYLASQLGYKSTLLIPESFFSELEEYMSENGLDSKLFHDGIRNSDEARERARQYSDKHPELTFLDQYNNDGSWLCHYHFTAEEILSELARLQLKPTHFISGIGSGGTLIGIGKKLKEGNDVKVIGLESKVPHSIRGIRCLETATTPGVYSRLSRVVDRVISIDPEDVARFRAEQQFNFGVSAYANIYASAQLSRELDSGIILTVVPDGGTE